MSHIFTYIYIYIRLFLKKKHTHTHTDMLSCFLAETGYLSFNRVRPDTAGPCHAGPAAAEPGAASGGLGESLALAARWVPWARISLTHLRDALAESRETFRGLVESRGFFPLL